MKRYQKLGIASTVIAIFVSVVQFFNTAGMIDLPRNIRLYVMYPLLLVLLLISLALWIISNRMRKNSGD